MHKKFALLLAGLAASGGAMLAAVPSASAALPSCYASSCHMKDPESYTCKNDARTIDAVTVNGRRIELRYSPSCRAAWGRITGGNPGDTVTIARTDGASNTKTISAGSDTHTLMLNDAGFASHARGKDEKTGFDATSPWTVWY